MFHRVRVLILAGIIIFGGAVIAAESTDAQGPYCHAGGPGAVQCSVSQGSYSCSVTCDEGKYACCVFGQTAPTCNCYSEE